MLSNFMNHHQYGLSEALYRLTDGNYTFVACEPVPLNRREMGYHEYAANQFHMRLTAENRDQIEKMILCCDVLICGSAPDELIAPRIRQHKLTFRASERLFKTPFTVTNLPHRIGSMLKHFIPYQNEMQYSLCASAYTPVDMSRFGCYRNRMYRWGYFPKAVTYDCDDLIVKKDPEKLLWCGRLVDWKRPDEAVRLMMRLKKDKINASLDIIGIGETEQRLRHMIRENGLEDRINLLGAMSPEQVREHMCRAGIYLMTSNRREGWGAVVNEAMNSGCAVVGSHIAGSVPYLIRHNVNGLVYRSGDEDMLYNCVKRLLADRDEQLRLGKKAYRTITESWNPDTAAERLIELSRHILAGERSPELYGEGPCSKAPIMKEEY